MESNILKIQDKAMDVLGDHGRALEWMDHMSGTLGDTPRVLAKTDEGTARVLLHLGGISRHSFN
jgi:uncharacterized protein (DUF2384 family)